MFESQPTKLDSRLWLSIFFTSIQDPGQKSQLSVTYENTNPDYDPESQKFEIVWNPMERSCL